MHGKQSDKKTDATCPIFKNLPSTIKGARYHSLAADKEDLPNVLKITAESDDGEVMAIMHKDFPVFGLQFHPESILTPMGNIIIENFLNL